MSENELLFSSHVTVPSGSGHHIDASSEIEIQNDRPAKAVKL
jgi:hypothetical protein